MRVDLLTKEYPPEVYGGAGVHVAELVRALRDRDDLTTHVHAFGAPRDEPLHRADRLLAQLHRDADDGAHADPLRRPSSRAATRMGVPACSSAFVTTSLTSRVAVSSRSSRPTVTSRSRTSRRASGTLAGTGGSRRLTSPGRSAVHVGGLTLLL